MSVSAQSEQEMAARLDALLAPFAERIGADLPGYRNHCLRMALFACDLSAAEEVVDPDAVEKIAMAAAFHDIGIWTDHTLDYLEPSVPPALEQLVVEGRERWAEEVGAMIVEHHRLRPLQAPFTPLVEIFRRADLVDFSLGLVRSGVPAARVRALRQRYPNAGFHGGLVKKWLSWFVRHPLKPLPMMRW